MKKKFLMMLFFVITGTITAQVCPFEDLFITRWKTDNSGISGSNQITLPLQSSGTYDFIVNWGDSSSDAITTYNQAEVTHTYENPGTYVITITGTLEGFRFNKQGDQQKIIEIIQWGGLQLGNLGGYFYGCYNLTITATDILNISGMTNMYRMFRGCRLITKIPNIEQWDMSNISNINSMFQGAFLFNQDLNTWDISSVTDIRNVFYSARSFNGDISSWDTSNVRDIHYMFAGARSFNQDISNWDVSGVNDMTSMFNGAYSFNKDISNWDVSGVGNMRFMFSGAYSFNRDISNWDVSGVGNMTSMFSGCTAFNQDIGNWDVSNVGKMENMFHLVELSTKNYDAILDGWSTDSSGVANDGIDDVPSNVTFNGGNSEYCSSSTQRDSLINTYGWTITDGGSSCPSANSAKVNNNLNFIDTDSSLSLYYENDTVLVNSNNLVSAVLIYNLEGNLLKEVKNETIGNLSIDVRELSAGVYISKITTDADVEIIRFVKE